MVKITQLLRKILVLLINLYSLLISPVLGQHCRFYPSCSSYAREVIENLGIMTGFFCILKRLLNCHPWHTGGFDPAPLKPYKFQRNK